MILLNIVLSSSTRTNRKNCTVSEVFEMLAKHGIAVFRHRCATTVDGDSVLVVLTDFVHSPLYDVAWALKQDYISVYSPVDDTGIYVGRYSHLQGAFDLNTFMGIEPTYYSVTLHTYQEGLDNLPKLVLPADSADEAKETAEAHLAERGLNPDIVDVEQCRCIDGIVYLD